jgi:hypothetical protein
MPVDTPVRLPAGWLDDAGNAHRDAILRPVCGADEEWLYGLPLAAPEAGVITGLLTRCVPRIGPVEPTDETVRALPVGDREWLILRLWQLTFGNRVELVLRCPRASCDARMDVEFALDEVPAGESPQRAEYEFEREGVRVRFRLPRGGDLEALGRAGTGAASDDERATVLLARCVLGIEGGGADGDGAADPASLLGAAGDLRAALAAQIERQSAAVEREFAARCPECERDFSGAFDPILAFLSEMLRRRAEFERDVHLLGLHYHWPLSEILAMARPRRRRYVRLLLDQLEPVPAAAPAAR